MDKTILNFSKWLTKNNILNDLDSITDKYFNNAPALTFDYISIELRAATIEELRQLENKVNKYMKRYNLDAWLKGRYWYNNYFNCYTYSLNVRTAAATKASENYYFYWDLAHNYFDIAHHVYIVMGIIDSNREEFNKLVRAKINYYGELYAKSLEAGENAA